MDYRDERDALRARVDSLEGEIASARSELERLAATEGALAEARRENEKLRAELRRLGPAVPSPRPVPIRALVAGSILLTMVVGGAVTAVVVAGRGGAAWLGSSPPERWAGPGEGSPARPREVRAHWQARIVQARGLPLEAGAACTLRATLRSRGDAAGTPDVEIECGGKTLYRSTDALAGTSTMSHVVEEAPGPEAGTYRAALSFDDQGPRTGERTQASVNTIAGVAIAWKDTAPAYRVELQVEELSEPWAGEALFARDATKAVSFRSILDRTGRAAVVKGFDLVPSGAECTVRVRPAFAGAQNCRVAVRCGGASLYGAEHGGFATCIVEDGRPIVARDPAPSDEDRDPVVEVNLAQSTVEVSDTRPSAWSVGIALTP